MKSPMTAALALLLAAACGLAAVPSHAAETFAYRLIPGKTTLRYAIPSGEEFREMFAGVSGTFGFTLNDDETITSTGFDLTIKGPFYDGTPQTPDWAPFAPGDKLADYLGVDFATAGGFRFEIQPNSTFPVQIHGVVKPDDGGSSTSFLGTSYYTITTLDRNPAVFHLESIARPELGGTFQLFTETETIDALPPVGSGNLGSDVVVKLLQPVPNVVRIPEPSAAALLIAGALGLGRRRK